MIQNKEVSRDMLICESFSDENEKVIEAHVDRH